MESQESGELRENDNQEQDKLDQGLNCSSMSIYNIYLSGNRVTRNRIRKEDERGMP